MKNIRIEGVHIGLDHEDLQKNKGSIEDLKKLEIFSHLPDAKQKPAYEALQKELNSYQPADEAVAVEYIGKEETTNADAVAGTQLNTDLPPAKSETKSYKKDQ